MPFALWPQPSVAGLYRENNHYQGHREGSVFGRTGHAWTQQRLTSLPLTIRFPRLDAPPGPCGLEDYESHESNK